jgi:predicted neutral ceramidase superfamily lipid hydrolase
MSDKLDEIVEYKATIDRTRVIIIGVVSIIVGSIFFLAGVLNLFVVIKELDTKQLPISLFFMFIGSTALYGYRLVLNRHRKNDNGLFPPIIIFIFGIFTIIGSVAMYFDRHVKWILLFGICFGTACIYLAFKRWRNA